MKKINKLNIIIACALLSQVAQAAGKPAKPYADGGTTGNGGVSVVCRDSSQKINSARLLDLYEAEELGIELGDDKSLTRLKFDRESQTSEKNLVKIALFKLSAAGLHNLAAVTLDEMNAEAKPSRWNLIPKSKGLPLSQDAFPKIHEKSCAFEQVALYRKSGRIDVDSEIMGDFSVLDKAATRVHEAIYKIAREQIAAQDSQAVRFLVAALFSEDQISEKNLRLLAYAAVGSDVANGTYGEESTWVAPKIQVVEAPKSVASAPLTLRKGNYFDKEESGNNVKITAHIFEKSIHLIDKYMGEMDFAWDPKAMLYRETTHGGKILTIDGPDKFTIVVPGGRSLGGSYIYKMDKN